MTTPPHLMFNATMGGNYSICSITASLPPLASLAFMLVVERVPNASVLARAGR